jgi:hypothetical protein
MQSVFKLTDLQQRKEPKTKQEFAIYINGEKETEKVEIVIKDKRKTTLVERDVLLKRLKRPVLQKGEELVAVEEKEELAIEESVAVAVEEDAAIAEEEEAIINTENDEQLEEPLVIEDEEAEAEEDGVAVAVEAEDEEAKEKKTKERVKKVRKEKDQEKVGPFDLTIEKIGESLVMDQIPKKQKITVPVSPYYMNNRKIHISQLAKLFKPYSDKIAAKAAELSCKTLQTQSVDFELLTHQLVVRDYLNLYTPYRGLLLFHGLGSGKTCTSIGIAEGMKTGKKIVLMTPASLKMNFFNELKKCGDVLYKKNQFWEFVSIVGDVTKVRMLSHVLGLEPEYIQKNGGAWLMNIKKPANFAELSDSEQKQIDQQIDHMIRNKYLDINYNGLRNEHLDKLTNGGKTNPFDNKVVIVDEAHNLVSRIANTGSKKGTIANKLYKNLMDATNTKIIFLTGTPIINTPREIAILFNMLRGFIKTWTFTLETTTSAKVNTEILMNYFRDDGLISYDYVEYTTNRLIITRNPFGFVNVYKKNTVDKRSTVNNNNNRNTVANNRNTVANRKTKGGKRHLSNKNKTKKLQDDDLFDYDDNEEDVKETEQEYNQLERDLYEGGGAFEEYSGVRLDEMGNISDAEFQSRIIRILNDHNIRVVGKPVIKKELCLPDKADVFGEMFINNENGELVNKDVLKRRILGLTSYFRSAQEQLLPSFVKTDSGANYHTISVDMSDYQFEEYEKVRKAERDEEKRKRKKKGIVEEEEKPNSTYRIYSRSACNFVFPAEHPRPYLAGKAGEPDEAEDLDEFDAIKTNKLQDDYFEEGEADDFVKEARIEDYQTRVQQTYDFLALKPDRKRSKEYLTETGLKIYSPKYLEILNRIKNEENRGLHLLYSQFRTLEGIGIFKLILEANGFVEFKVVKNGSQWDIENFDKDPEKPRFVLYTGTETPEEKDIVRNIYNGSWNIVPPSIVEKLKERHENNLYGEVIKLLMITASGAEGINLRNTRFVHIMEPYWNMVRIDQVVGRARRICSHEDLPEELRNVEVFIYLCRATEEQIDKNIELRINDLSKLSYKVLDVKRGREIVERVPFTTDQYLFEIAQIKDSITRQILTSVKETAMDCSLYNNNPDEPLVCYGFGKVEPQSFASYPTLERDAQEKTQDRKEKKSLAAITLDGVKYAFDKKTLAVYDFNSYVKAKEQKGELVELGILDMRTKTIQFV